MKKLIKKIAAVSAALVMSVSVFGTTTSAVMLREDVADSWVMTDRGWVFVMPDGKDAVNRLAKIDGVMYKFGSRAHDYERYSGWTKSSDGTRRRYSKGLPYTGWLKYKNGQRRYCLDGYMATDNMQIGDHLYTFDKEGFYTGKTALTLITKCDKFVSSDADEIKVALKNLDGRDYNFGVLSKMERWEKGKWVNCWGDWVGENGEELAYFSIGYFLKNKGDIMELDINPQLYTNYNFTEGYYRIPIGSWIKQYKNQYECYATFQVVPPVEVSLSEDINRKDIYISDGNTPVNIEVWLKTNSDKLDGNDAYSSVYKMTGKGWIDTSLVIYDNEENYDENSYTLENGKSVSGWHKIENGEGYYKTVVTVDGQKYEKYFRIQNEVRAVPWFDSYSNKDEILTVCLDVSSGFDSDFITTDVNVYHLYKWENGEWKQIPPDKKIDVSSPKRTVEQNETMVVYAYISEMYDVSKLEVNGHGTEYAVYVDGCGYVPFTLDTVKPIKERYPFADLDAEDVEQVESIIHIGSTDDDDMEAVSSREEDKKNIVAVLKHIEVTEETDGYPKDIVGAGQTIRLVHKDGSVTECGIFANTLKYNGKYYSFGADFVEQELCKINERMRFLGDEMPYDDLAAESIEKIKLTESAWMRNTSYTTRKADKIKEIVDELNQLKLITQIENSFDADGGSTLTVEIFYKDGSSEEISFTDYSGIVLTSEYNERMRVSCTKDTYLALKKIFNEAADN